MTVTAACLIVAGLVYALDRFGLLPHRKSAADAAAELAIAEQSIHRLVAERDTAKARGDLLEQTRSLEPILDLVRQVFETQQQTLDKLAHFNGALKRNEEGLLAATEALKMVAGLVVGALEIPTKERS